MQQDRQTYEYSSKSSEWSDDFCKESKRQYGRHGSCVSTMSGCSCFISVLTSGLVVYLLLKVSNMEDVPAQEYHPKALHSKQEMHTADANIGGSFKLNQEFLKYHSGVRWLTDEHSNIIPSDDDSCLKVPFGGKFLVISRFTFNILPNVNTTVIIHILKVENSDGAMKAGSFKRKYVSILENKLRATGNVQTNSELRKPSVFIEFYELNANDSVCVGVSHPELLYQSSMDNDVNIIEV